MENVITNNMKNPLNAICQGQEQVSHIVVRLSVQDFWYRIEHLPTCTTIHVRPQVGFVQPPQPVTCVGPPCVDDGFFILLIIIFSTFVG